VEIDGIEGRRVIEMKNFELKVDLDKFKQEQQERKYSYSTFFEIKPGENPLRLLPRSMKIFTQGDYLFAHRYFVHYNMFDVQGYRMIACPMTYKDTCPICEYVSQENEREKVSRIRRQERFIYNVFDLADETLKVLETGPQVYDGFTRYWLDSEWGPGKMVGVETGCMFKIVFVPSEKSSTGWNHYDVVATPKVVDLTQKLPENWEETVDSLESKIPIVRSKEELSKLLECYLKGISPAAEETKKREEVFEERAKELEALAKQQNSQPAQLVKQEGQPAQPLQKIPDCFGVSFAPRDQKCKVCVYWTKCRDAFVSVE
jgi:hypothetical protein